MGRIYLFFAFYVISSPNIIDIFVFIVDSLGRNWHPRFKFFSINRIIFREIQVYKTCNCMPITSISYIPLLIMVFVNNLLIKSGRFVIVWIKLFIRLLSFLELICNCILFFRIKFIDIIKILLMLLFFVLKLKVMDFFTVSLLELMIFFHNTIHIVIVDVNIDNLLSLLYCFIFVF